MSVLSFGPLVMAGDSLAAVIGIAIFVGVTLILAVRVDPRLGRWSSHALIVGFVGARLAHVLEFAANFAAEPWRIVAVWQGGFSWGGAAVAIALISLLHLRSLRLGLWASFALGLSLVVWNTAYQLTSATAATPLPALTLKHINGKGIPFETIKGKPAVINLWATWCPPCRREMPMMTKVAASTPDVTFLFVNQGESAAQVKAYLDSAELTPKHVLLDPLRTTAQHYGMPGLPATLFIGADGLTRVTYVGEMSRETLSKYISRLLER
jgi:thiol-disulfide isomerase/thioredoxin